MSTAAITAEGAVEVRDRGDVRRQVRLAVVFGLVLVALLFFWWRVDAFTLTYTLGERVTQDDPAKTVGSRPFLVASVLAAAAAFLLALANKVPRGWLGALVYLVVGVAFFTGFLVWSYTDQTGAFSVALINPFPGTVRLATPLIFGALAGCLCERAGVINIAIEGQFLMGAFFASVASSLAFSAE